MTVTLTLIRGLPGSGKSTLAKQQAEQTDAIHLETDMYFINSQGDYVFNPQYLSQAHEWCFQQTALALDAGNNVIVSNTFVKRWEMERYIQLTVKQGYQLDVIVCRGKYQSIHSVPQATLNKMRRQWQD